MLICESCERECTLITVDFGIGAYEYWGAPGIDVQLAEVTDCCEAGLKELFEETSGPTEEWEVV